MVKKIITKKLLELHHLSAGYGELQIVKDVSLHVDAGEIVALIGPNGAGKSTILKTVFSLADITAGEIFFQDKNMSKEKTHELIKQGICYVNQGRIIFNNLTVLENLLIGIINLRDQEERKQRLAAVFKRFPVLAERKSQLAFCFSGGQRQQLALARALVQQPKLLLLDEPSLGLSPKLQREVFQSIASLRGDGIAVLLVEQNAKKAIEIADRTYVLEDGKIVLSGGREIINHPQIKQVYLGGR